MDSKQSDKSSVSQEKFLGLSHRHRCFRCRRFYGSCRCARRMYHHYRSGCMCRMVFKFVLIIMVIYMISRWMRSNRNFLN